MLRAKLWNKSVPRVELDQRAREARLRLERIERQLLPRALTRSRSGGSFIFAAAAFSSARREKAGLEGR
jgi:hypothetical protein